MKYYSTNHTAPEVALGEAVVRGLAPDKGLYMPERIEKLPRSFYDGIASMSFHEIACRVAEAFFGDDIEHETLRKIVCDTLSFETPVVRVEPGIYSLELFHGPTLAFKDVGARFMARMLSHFIGRDNGRVTVLVATSGDTGSAVANGFLGVEGIDVVVLYPKGKVSEIQDNDVFHMSYFKISNHSGLMNSVETDINRTSFSVTNPNRNPSCGSGAVKVPFSRFNVPPTVGAAILTGSRAGSPGDSSTSISSS
jgi:threonine synthase